MADSRSLKEGDRVRVSRIWLNRMRADALFVDPIVGVGTIRVAWYRVAWVVWEDGVCRIIERDRLEKVEEESWARLNES